MLLPEWNNLTAHQVSAMNLQQFIINTSIVANLILLHVISMLYIATSFGFFD